MSYTFQSSLRAIAILGVADHLTKEAKTAAEIGEEIGVDGKKLHRLMRLLATQNIFHQLDNMKFMLNPVAEFLCTTHPYSLRHAVLMLTDETMWRPLGNIVEEVQGHSAFKQLYGISFFEYWSKPQKRTPQYDFHTGMASMSEIENLFLVKNYDFPKNVTVVDVAGGLGRLLLKVLEENPTLHGILFDQQHVLPRNHLSKLGDDSRWRLQPGSFFEECPPADIYMIKHIVHDWPDNKSVEILRNCRKAMNPNGKILIMDSIIPEDNAPNFGKKLDVFLMGSFDGGREHTEDELKELLAQAGLKINRIIDTGSYLSIIETIAS
ncbi:methyltransferase [Yersinia enterocolitica]